MNHAAVAVGHKVYSFGGYCSGEDYETLRQIDVHVFNAGKRVLLGTKDLLGSVVALLAFCCLTCYTL